MLTVKEVAEKLDGSHYPGPNISEEFQAELEEAGIVVLYGASDDLTEIAGAYYDEVGAGTMIRFDENGKMVTANDSECDSRDECPYFERYFHTLPFWIHSSDDLPWAYETNIPGVERFNVIEVYNGEAGHYGQGIVFSINDMK